MSVLITFLLMHFKQSSLIIRNPDTQVAATLAPVFPSNQAPMLPPRDALPVLMENLRVRVEEGRGEQTPALEPVWSPWQFPVLSSTARALWLIYPCQGPLNRVTSLGWQEPSLTHSKEDKNMSLESDTSDLIVSVATSSLSNLWAGPVCFIFCE